MTVLYSVGEKNNGDKQTSPFSHMRSKFSFACEIAIFFNTF